MSFGVMEGKHIMNPRVKATWLLISTALTLALAVGPVVQQEADAAWLENESGGYHNYYWNSLSNPKLRYNLTNHQWWHYGAHDATHWYAISATERPSTFIGNGSWHNLGNGFSYQYATATDIGWFKDGSDYRFRYKYSPGLWESTWNPAPGGPYSWQVLGVVGLSAAFVGNGDWADLGNGFTYRYTTADDIGCFKDGAYERFRYLYATRQWENTANSVSWQTLGNAGLSAAFLGSGIWWNLGNGFKYQYAISTDIGWFKEGSDYRFRYKYSPGLWESTWNPVAGGPYSWQALGIVGHSAAFVGGGDWADLGNGFTYRYTTADDIGCFKDGAYERFRYLYATRQWENTANSVSWQTLGNAGLSAAFLGSGIWWNLGNGFKYQYAISTDMGWFKEGSDYRFRYKYGPGQWEHRGYGGSWYNLGGGGASFVGDGAYHYLGNNFWYKWVLSSGTQYGYWSIDGTDAHRIYEFNYTTGQWQHQGYTGGWFALGVPGQSGQFIADGTYYNVGGGWWYHSSYSASGLGIWSRTSSSSGDRFSYIYTSGQWLHKGNNGSFDPLGASGRSASFIGTPVAKELGDLWWYTYYYGSDNAYWTRTSDPNTSRFTYKYDTGQWRHRGYGGSWNNLGSDGRSSAWIGDDTAWHDLGDGWSYKYTIGVDWGDWSRDGTDAGKRFSYVYNVGWWYQYGQWGGSILHNSSNPMPSAFIGDGEYHNVGTLGSTVWHFQYLREGDGAFWSLDGADTGHRFGYQYGSGSWYHKGDHGGFNPLGHAGMDCSFLGDGSIHNLQNGHSYQWNSTNVGIWTWTSTGTDHYKYSYDEGLWFQWWGIGWSIVGGPSAGTDLFNPGES